MVLPELNTVLRIGVGTSADPDDEMRALDVASRVEDVEPPVAGRGGHLGRVMIATPMYVGDTDEPRIGTACTLTWTTSSGILELPTALNETLAPKPGGALRTWWLNVTGEVKRVQRREYFRCVCSLPLTVTVLPPRPGDPPVDDDALPEAADGGPLVVQGVTTDLSEGGLRCIVPTHGLSQRCVRVDLEVEPGQLLTLDGTVLRTAAVAAVAAPAAFGTVQPVETVIAFRSPEMYGDSLRKAIFAEQMRQRRAALT